MNATLLSIGEVARRFGVRVSALRYYDELNLLAPAERRGGKRWYGERELRRLAFIRLMQDTYLLSLDEIRELVDGPANGWRRVMRERMRRIDEQMERLRAARECLDLFQNCTRAHPAQECPKLLGQLRSDVEEALAAGG